MAWSASAGGLAIEFSQAAHYQLADTKLRLVEGTGALVEQPVSIHPEHASKNELGYERDFVSEALWIAEQAILNMLEEWS